jgi:hypothetical protein
MLSFKKHNLAVHTGQGWKREKLGGRGNKGSKGRRNCGPLSTGAPIDFLPTTGATIRCDSRQRCTITGCTLREPATPCATPTRKKHRPLEDAEEEEQEEEQGENEEKKRR